MTIDKTELEKEKDYLQNTISLIEELIGKQDDSIKIKIDSINEMKKYIWKNMGTLDDTEVIQGMVDVNNDVNTTNSSIESLEKLKRSLLNPYFGRIDFTLNGHNEKIYIGINGVDKDFKFYVYDWRSPVASLFYNYGIGSASYEAPKGKINVNIDLKRQYKISDGKLERCFNSDINIDDDFLQEILSKASTEKMTNIVSTIQQEQNEIIRNIVDKYLIVQGIAGSGKTSVALHRIAYLLYKQKDLTSNNVLIFSPNDVFANYISDVLPELGENNVLQTTFSDFSQAYLKDFKNIESFTNFVEKYYTKDGMPREEFEEIKYKLSDSFKKEIDAYLDRVKQNISFRSGIKINDKEITKEELTDIFVNKYSKLALTYRMEVLVEYICDYYNISYKKYYNKIKEKLVNSINTKLDSKSLYVNMLKSNIHSQKTNYCYDEDFDINSNLNYEDLIPMLYLYFETNGYPFGNTIKHIVIDEVQDYTILQLEILKKIFRTASFTILGDKNQTINPYYKYDTLNDINNIFDNKGKYIELNKTYRSSEEIIEYTNKILDLDNSCSIRRSNQIPVVTKNVEVNEVINNIMQDIDTMRKNGMKKISIITKSDDEAIKLYKALKNDLDDVVIIDNNGNQKISEIVILPSYISKGLEFDSVIACVNKDNLYKENEKNLFYVVCTRAQHSLTVYNQKVMEKKKK